MATSIKQIQLRRHPAATWTSNNPTLAAGEVGFETDTGQFKIGNGATAWTALDYVGGPITAAGFALMGAADDGAQRIALGLESGTADLDVDDLNANSVTASGDVSGDAVIVAADGGLELQSQTVSGGAAAGSLTNAPVAGNPTHWLRILVNGNVVHFPGWQP